MPLAESGPRSIAARLAAGRELLASDSQRYAVQLMVTDARERGYLENYLMEAGRALRPEQLYLVPAGNPETPRLGVLFGAFDERGDASTALASLPESLRQFRPYVRPLDAVREDARRAERK
jgi:septal ring-binding cell division protein DamX